MIDFEQRHGLALEHYAAGRLGDARQLYEEMLATAGADARSLTMLGVITAQARDLGRAERLFKAAITVEPSSGDLHLNLGFCRRERARPEAAAHAFSRAVHLTPGDARALVALAQTDMSRAPAAAATRAAQQALCLGPASFETWAALGQIRFATDAAAAATAFARALALQPLANDLQTTLAAARLHAGDLKGAWSAYERVLMQRRASRWVDPELARSAGPPSGHVSFTETSRTKLGHDLQQLRHLLDLNLLPREFEGTISAYESVLAELGDLPLVTLTPDQSRRLGPTYNRVIHRRPAKPDLGPAVNPSLDDAAIARRFQAQRPGIVWVDDVLTPGALEELRRYCLESTVWFDYRHPPGYVGAMLVDGFNSPLLLQIAEELPRRLPSLFGNEKLLQLWAFKYESGHAGTALHADAARLNVNIWITPDEANLTPERAGLEVWDRMAPAEWDFDKFNNDQAAIRRFLAESGAASIRIPYRCNRAAIFDSDLFHRTDDFRFKPGYANRRINVTMLYGVRGGRSSA